MLLLCALLFITLDTRADDSKEVGQLVYLCNSDNNTATLDHVSSTSKPAEGTALTIPETIDVDGTTYKVTALNANCLSTENGCPLLGSITLPSTVKTIGENAFKGQTMLTSVNFPDVETIGEGAFYGCTSLKEAYLGIYTTVIGANRNGYIFGSDVPLEKLTLSRAETNKSTNDKDDVKGIIFQPLTNLKELYLPALKTLKHGVAFNYKALTTIDAPKLENIPSGTFSSCDELESVYLPSVKTIEDGSFNSCDKLKEIDCPVCTSVNAHFADKTPNLKILNFPGIKDVGEHLFAEISTVTTINLPNAENIGDFAFQGCTSLTELVAPNVKTIGDDAFLQCSSLTSVNMPYVTSIGDHAFDGCTKLSSVNMPVLQSMYGNSFEGDVLLTELHLPKLTTLLKTVIYIPNIKVLDLPELTTYEILPGLANHSTTLEEFNAPKLETLNYDFFSGCTNLKKVNVEAAKTIRGSAFSGCTSLDSLSLPSATSIDQYAFKGCTALEYLDLHSAKSIGGGVLNGCTALKYLDLHSAKSIGGGVLNGCTALEYLDLPSATSITDGAFQGCTALKYLHLGPGITDVSGGKLAISLTALDHDVHIKLDYKGGVVESQYLVAQKDRYIFHVDYSLLHSYMNDDSLKNCIFERTLDDESETQFTNGHYYFSLKRALKQGEWSTLVLPFSLSAEEVKAMFGDNVKLAKYTGSTKNSEEGYILNFEKTETITAGEPVLICGADEKSDNTYLAGKLTLGTDDNRGSDVESTVSMTDPTTDTNNKFNLKGTYTHNDSFIQAGDYYLGSGNALHHAKSAKPLSSARMVVRYEGNDAHAKLAGLSFDGVTTGIDEVRMDNETLEALNACTTAKVYNLNGQRVGTGYKGIVIINGKKIFKN